MCVYFKELQNKFNQIGSTMSFVEMYSKAQQATAAWAEHAQAQGYTIRKNSDYRQLKWNYISELWPQVWSSAREFAAFCTFLTHTSSNDVAESDDEDAISDVLATDGFFGKYAAYCNRRVAFKNVQSSTVGYANAAIGRLYLYKKPESWKRVALTSALVATPLLIVCNDDHDCFAGVACAHCVFR